MTLLQEINEAYIYDEVANKMQPNLNTEDEKIAEINKVLMKMYPDNIKQVQKYMDDDDFLADTLMSYK